MFSGLSTNAAPGASVAQPQRQSSIQQLAAQRAASLDKSADPLSILGLPQAPQAPMGQGLSAQRGSSPAPTPSYQGKTPIQIALQICKFLTTALTVALRLSSGLHLMHMSDTSH